MPTMTKQEQQSLLILANTLDQVRFLTDPNADFSGGQREMFRQQALDSVATLDHSTLSALLRRIAHDSLPDEQSRRAAADEAYEKCDFGALVGESFGWEWQVPGNIWERRVALERTDGGGSDLCVLQGDFRAGNVRCSVYETGRCGPCRSGHAPMTRRQETDIRGAGMRAFRSGLTKDGCPYPGNSLGAWAWHFGFELARNTEQNR